VSVPPDQPPRTGEDEKAEVRPADDRWAGQRQPIWRDRGRVGARSGPRDIQVRRTGFV